MVCPSRAAEPHDRAFPGSLGTRGNLKEIDLSGTRMSDASWEILLNSPNFASLTWINTHGAIMSDGMEKRIQQRYGIAWTSDSRC